MTLYQRLLADRFAGLHPVLREFHGRSAGAHARGLFHVRRPRGWLTNQLASLFGMPAAGRNVPVELTIVPDGTGERWRRTFAGQLLVTKQEHADGLLVESFGPVRFGLALTVAAGGLAFHTRRVWLGFVPLPRRCAPTVVARVTPDAMGWRVRVRLCCPLLGSLIHYAGRVTPS
jgi:hypothetical protein